LWIIHTQRFAFRTAKWHSRKAPSAVSNRAEAVGRAQLGLPGASGARRGVFGNEPQLLDRSSSWNFCLNTRLYQPLSMAALALLVNSATGIYSWN